MVASLEADDISWTAKLDLPNLSIIRYVIDAPGAYDNYKPGNYETWNYEGSVRLRHGLAHSINSVAVRLAATPVRLADSWMTAAIKALDMCKTPR